MPSYSLNWRAWITLLLPSFLRRAQHIEWLLVLSWPVVELYVAFQAWRTEVLAQLTYSGQTIALERMLNEVYLGTWSAQGPNPIFILETNETSLSGGSYLPDLGQGALYLGTVYLGDQASTGNAAVAGFVVRVPASLVFDPLEMRRRIDRYRLAGVTYRIETY